MITDQMTQSRNFVDKNAKLYNHWKLFLQIFIFASGAFTHNNVVTFFSSYFPSFENFRKNKAGKGWVTFLNFILDFVLTTPILFLAFTFYVKGLYIMLPISFFVVYILPLLNKTANVVRFGHNSRRSIVTVAPRKFKFMFLDYQISTIFFLMCFGIMYADTSMFDKNLSKTIKNGIGTMDLGAGLILFTSGMTSRQARGNFLLNP
jgi:hypothetical protein